jgi:hypothetical protein
MSAESASKALQSAYCRAERPLPQPPGNVTRNGLLLSQKAGQAQFSSVMTSKGPRRAEVEIGNEAMPQS